MTRWAWHRACRVHRRCGDDAASLSYGTSILELQRAWRRDALLFGLGGRWRGQVAAKQDAADARPQPKPAPSAQERLQGRCVADHVDARAPARSGVPASAHDYQTELGSPDHRPSARSRGAGDVEAWRGLRADQTRRQWNDHVVRRAPQSAIRSGSCGPKAVLTPLRKFRGRASTETLAVRCSGHAPVPGYAPSELPTEAMAHEAQRRGWCPFSAPQNTASSRHRSTRPAPPLPSTHRLHQGPPATQA
jgi:hypothetical protein